jgi:hypothetical protein
MEVFPMYTKRIAMTLLIWVLIGPVSALIMDKVGKAKVESWRAYIVPPVMGQASGCQGSGRGEPLRVMGNAAAPEKAKNAAQARVLALEGARVMAYKQLAECVGVAIRGDAKVEEGTGTGAGGELAVKEIVRGARVVSEKIEVLDDKSIMGVVTLEVSVPAK